MTKLFNYVCPTHISKKRHDYFEVEPLVAPLLTDTLFGGTDEPFQVIKTPVYNLALRMLHMPQDAEDTAQEILIKVTTRLSSFRGESAFMTWVYRVATNHLLNERRKNARQALDFDSLGRRLQHSLALYEDGPLDVVEDALLVEEVKRNCTLGMLQCLDATQRQTLILGEIYGVSSEQGAYIMDVSPAAFRKRLSRARASMVSFVSHQCGVVNSENACRCHKHVRNKVRFEGLAKQTIRFADQSDEACQQAALLAERETLAAHRRTAALLRAHPHYQASSSYAEAVKALI